MNDSDYPQPHEGIVGQARDEDDLLSLEETALPRRAMMVVLVKHLRDAVTVGNPAPRVERMSERIRAPQIGDLVIETSRGIYRGPTVEAFGILIAHRREWETTDAEWDTWIAEQRQDDPDFQPDERLTDDSWYVQYGPRPG